MFTYGEIAPPRSPRLTDSLAPFYTVGRWSQPRGDGGDRNEKNWGCLWGYYCNIGCSLKISQKKGSKKSSLSDLMTKLGREIFEVDIMEPSGFVKTRSVSHWSGSGPLETKQ